jgi:release factor glutamine methyltransferase
MDTFEALIRRRLDHEPVARIIGRRMFWGRDFKITLQVLDPRPETETLIAAALELEGAPPATFLDLGTGSGIIAVTLAAEWPGARGFATDLSDDALAVARENAAAHGVEARIGFARADWFAGVIGQFDLIVSNPPYIAADEMAGLAPEVRGHDPEPALTPGGDGLGAYRAIAAGAPAHLAPGGHLLVEIGPSQGAAVAALFRAAGLVGVRVLPDLDNRDRVVAGQLATRTP